MHLACFVFLKWNGVHFPTAETAWHSALCSLWPSDVPRSCNVGHSCFLLTFRHLSFAKTNSLCFLSRKEMADIYLELEGKCSLYRSIMLYRSADISFFCIGHWPEAISWHFISLLIAIFVIWPPLAPQHVSEFPFTMSLSSRNRSANAVERLWGFLLTLYFQC